MNVLNNNQANNGTREPLYACAKVDANNAWVAGVAGTVLSTSTGGLPVAVQSDGTQVSGFRKVASGATAALVGGVSQDVIAMRFPSSTGLVGVAVGKSGLAMRYTPASGWVAVPSGVSTDLRDVDFSDVTNGLAVGASGTLLRTATGGTSWSPVAAPGLSGVDITSVFLGPPASPPPTAVSPNSPWPDRPAGRCRAA